ncbi:MAG: SDR family NAD(P)-dependent oxidoreductase [Pseudomonadales bacterium]|jgi:NAD(P)-dependent dehydrogenase (short-subunit alcohol dehydrogenase family)|nr:SDR family NAD(P)-dependent oxidoreductase [Pseudomonadales bacterium]MDP7597369.1 SDR family NAD(P)-dependent oxidoreductase [Pseudomonadales bacterium]HJN51490.1 SDR family NAD(P)-dependent oxidoreductase [Pseudomonadales bacterium]|tara:strand:- start:514 stop:1365 length:852 start_codon:yes stop_codon:yes gene_type:complete
MHTPDGQRFKNLPFPLEGKLALVAGARKGMGSAIALTFAEAGADVAVCDRVIEDGEMEALAEEIQGMGQRSLALQTNLMNQDEVDNMVERIEGELGPIDILADTVGGARGPSGSAPRPPAEGPHAPEGPHFLDFTEQDWNFIIDLNLKTCFLCCQAVAKRMVHRGAGNIITVSSEMGIRGPSTLPIYHVAKAGVIMLTKMMAYQLAPYKIRVNCIAPGATAGTHLSTPWSSNPAVLETMKDRQPLREVAESSDMASVALFLASDAARFITGETILSDGGLMLT